MCYVQHSLGLCHSALISSLALVPQIHLYLSFTTGFGKIEHIFSLWVVISYFIVMWIAEIQNIGCSSLRFIPPACSNLDGDCLFLPDFVLSPRAQACFPLCLLIYSPGLGKGAFGCFLGRTTACCLASSPAWDQRLLLGLLPSENSLTRPRWRLLLLSLAADWELESILSRPYCLIRIYFYFSFLVPKGNWEPAHSATVISKN